VISPLETFRARLSLTQRLSLLFAIVSFAILSAMGVFLHQTLTQQFMQRDAQDLNGKIELVRHTLVGIDGVPTLERNPQRWLDIIVGHHGLSLAIFTTDLRRVLASPEYSVADALVANPAAESQQTAPVIEWVNTAGTRFRVVAALGKLGRTSNERVVIVFALDISDEIQLLSTYRASIMGAIAVGTLLAAVLGLWISRQGLTPLGTFAAGAGRITASRLDERLDVASLPDELKPLALAHNAMLDRLRDSFSRLSQFSSDLAHDLRTPLGNLLGEAQVALTRSRSSDEYRAVIESSVEELERLSRMIESMLFLARADNAQLALRPERLPMDIELARIRDYFEPLAQEKALGIEVTAGADHVFADATLLTRAMGNLVANAITVAPSASGSIDISATSGTDGTVIRVSNPGPEIPLTERERVFDRFYRIGASRADSNAGSGLGLAIVKSIMTLHGGRVWVECAAGRTTFSMSFPESTTRGSESGKST
jgi:two-component system heavy metal sensor histidine kinase CusS